ncbi:hypothetical protein ACOMHN_034701 [Nucella lapillus]
MKRFCRMFAVAIFAQFSCADLSAGEAPLENPFPFGTIGCLASDVCGPGEVCKDDLLFGSCQNVFTMYRAASLIPGGADGFRLDSGQIQDLEDAIVILIRGGFSWQDAYTQCTLQNLLLSFQRGLLFTPRLCEDALGVSLPAAKPRGRYTEDEVTSTLQRLFPSAGFGGRSSDSFLSPYSRLDQSWESNEIPESLMGGDEDSFGDLNQRGMYPRANDYLGSRGYGEGGYGDMGLLDSRKRDEFVQVHKYFDQSKGQLKRDSILGGDPYNVLAAFPQQQAVPGDQGLGNRYEEEDGEGSEDSDFFLPLLVDSAGSPQDDSMGREGGEVFNLPPVQDGIPYDVIPEDVIPDDVIPEDVIPDDVIPEDVIPYDVIPDDVIPDDVIPDDVIPEDVIPDDVIPEDVIPDDVIPEDVIPNDVIPEDVIPDPATELQLGGGEGEETFPESPQMEDEPWEEEEGQEKVLSLTPRDERTLEQLLEGSVELGDLPAGQQTRLSEVIETMVSLLNTQHSATRQQLQPIGADDNGDDNIGDVETKVDNDDNVDVDEEENLPPQKELAEGKLTEETGVLLDVGPSDVDHHGDDDDVGVVHKKSASGSGGEPAKVEKRLDEASTRYGMEIGAEKTEHVTNSEDPAKREIIVSDQQLKTVKNLDAVIRKRSSLFSGETRDCEDGLSDARCVLGSSEDVVWSLGTNQSGISAHSSDGAYIQAC